MSKSIEDSLPIIKSSIKPGEYHEQYPKIIEYAKKQGVFNIITGLKQVKTSVYCSVLAERIQKEELDLVEIVMKKLKIFPSTPTTTRHQSSRSIQIDLRYWRLNNLEW